MGDTEDMKPTKPMTQAERNELRKLVKQRFELLRERLNAMEAGIKANLRKTLRDEADTMLGNARRESEDLRQRWTDEDAGLAPIRREIADLESKLQRAEGDMNERFKAEFKAVEKRYPHLDFDAGYSGVKRPGDMEGRRWLVDVDESVVREQYAQIAAEKGFARTDLAEQENQLLTEITVGAIQSDEGLSLMARIPEANQILPAAQQAAGEIEAAEA